MWVCLDRLFGVSLGCKICAVLFAYCDRFVVDSFVDSWQMLCVGGIVDLGCLGCLCGGLMLLGLYLCCCFCGFIVYAIWYISFCNSFVFCIAVIYYYFALW